MTAHYSSSSLELNPDTLDTLCHHYLRILYHNALKESPSDKNINETYGEILYAGIDKIISIIKVSQQDVFIDYGSGLGKIVIQIFLKSLVKEAYGIEISPILHQQAMNAAQKLHQDLPEFYNNERRLDFLLGNFLEVSLPKATIAMVSATCFTQSLLSDLGRIIDHTPSLHTVISLRPIRTLQRLVFKKSINVECSWGTSLCYIYS